MGITAVIGSQGHGKSFLMTWVGIDFALKYCRRLVTNYPLNLHALERFAFGNNFRNLYKLIHDGDIIYVPYSVELLLSIPDSVVLFDEAPIFLGDSTRANISYLISRFNQCRRRHIELFYAAQAFERTPKILRDVTTTVIHCEGICKRDDQGLPTLLVTKYKYFDVNEYYTWFSSPKRNQRVFTWQKSFRQVTFPLKVFHLEIFNIYESFGDIIESSYIVPGYKFQALDKRTELAAKKALQNNDFKDENIKNYVEPFKAKPFKISPFMCRFFYNICRKISLKTNDYLYSKKWEITKSRWRNFDPKSLKLTHQADKFDGEFSGVFYSDGYFDEYPNYLAGWFVIYWRFSNFFPADFQLLLQRIANSFNFGVSSNSKFLKSRSFK